jgi:hypothetical protein
MKALGFQKARPYLILLFLLPFCVVSSIHLNDDTTFPTHKIDNIVADNMLSQEFNFPSS